MECLMPKSSMIEEEYHIFAAMYFIFLICGVLGNSVSLICLFKLDETEICSNIILKYLAISDFFVSLVGMPLMGMRFVKRNLLNDCVYQSFMAYFNMCGASTSSVAVLVLAFERYILLTKPHKYNTLINKKKINIVIRTLWIFLVVGLSMRLYLPKISLAILFVVNITVIVSLPIAYFKIINFVKRARDDVARNQQTSGQGTNTTSTDSINNRIDKRVTFKVMLIVFGYYIFNVPISIINIPYSLGKLDSYAAFAQATIFLAVANSCVNPVLYFATDQRIRAQFLMIFLRRRPRVGGNNGIQLSPMELQAETVLKETSKPVCHKSEVGEHRDR